MSFILEALKKSEQQKRQQQPSTSPQEVRKRTLFLLPGHSGWRSYRKAAFIPLILVGGWFLYSSMDSTQPPTPQVNRVMPPPASVNQAKAPEPPATAPSPQANSQKLPMAMAEPSPVPRETTPAPSAMPELLPAISSAPPSIMSQAPTTEPPQDEAEAPTESLSTDEHGTTATFTQSEPSVDEAAPLAPQQSQPPPFLDLPKEFRDRMPQLNMSMHYYSTSPGRSLVRINERLLHEGEWLNSELQIITITPSGVTMNFLGKAFTMANPSQ